jgi:integrase
MLMHLALGLRVSEIMGLRWDEFDPDARTIAVSGKVVRAEGVGLLRNPTFDSSKGAAPLLALPQFVVDMLLARAQEERLNLCGAIFPSTVGTLRDPNGFARQWREVRDDLGAHLEKATGHSFRKTLGNLVADHTSDVRVVADVLGHSDMQTTMKHYLNRGEVHPEVARIMENAVRGKRKITKKSVRRRV